MIEVVDLKGHYWAFKLPHWREDGVLWLFSFNPPPYELRKYGAIPVPVFTEWWP